MTTQKHPLRFRGWLNGVQYTGTRRTTVVTGRGALAAGGDVSTRGGR